MDADTAQIDLWNKRSGETVTAVLSLQWDGVNARLSLEAPELGLSLQAEGPDLFDALQQLRKQTLEPLGWVPLCNGARVDCYPSGMARDMGGGQVVYVLSARPRLSVGRYGPRLRRPLVDTFEPAPKKSVGTVEDQDAYFRTWLDSRRRASSGRVQLTRN